MNLISIDDIVGALTTQCPRLKEHDHQDHLLRPFLLSNELAGNCLSKGVDDSEEICGLPYFRSRLQRLWGQSWITDNIPDVIGSKLGLQVCENSAMEKELARQLHALPARIPPWANDAWLHILKFTRLVSIVSPTSREGTHFASTSFWLYPFATFVTVGAAFYVPPVYQFASPSDYAVFENLFHEALHQELTEFLRIRFSIGDECRLDQVFCRPSWREADWSLEHCFHALYVYRSLARLRDMALYSSDNFAQFLPAAAASGAAAASKELLQAIENVIKPSSPAAALLEKILRRSA
jgi:hypothetical protein